MNLFRPLRGHFGSGGKSMQILKITLEVVVVILGYVIALKTNKGKGMRWVILIMVLLAMVLIPWKNMAEYKGAKKLEEQYDSLRVNYDSLQNKMSGVKDKLDSIGQVWYPGLTNEQVLNKLALEVSEIRRGMQENMHPSLDLVKGQERVVYDSLHDCYRQSYSFRASYPTAIQDAQLHLRFNGRVSGARCSKSNLSTLIHMEEGCPVGIDKDTMGISLVIPFLDKGWIVTVEIISGKRLSLLSVQ